MEHLGASRDTEQCRRLQNSLQTAALCLPFKKICRVGKISDAAYFQTLAHLCKGSSLLALTFKHNFFSLWDGTATKSCAAHLANHTR